MTSLSRIIRSVHTQSNGDHVKKIQIREMFELHEIEDGEIQPQKQITMEEVLEERERLLAEARATRKANILPGNRTFKARLGRRTT